MFNKDSIYKCNRTASATETAAVEHSVNITNCINLKKYHSLASNFDIYTTTLFTIW